MLLYFFNFYKYKSRKVYPAGTDVWGGVGSGGAGENTRTLTLQVLVKLQIGLSCSGKELPSRWGEEVLVGLLRKTASQQEAPRKFNKQTGRSKLLFVIQASSLPVAPPNRGQLAKLKCVPSIARLGIEVWVWTEDKSLITETQASTNDTALERQSEGS